MDLFNVGQNLGEGNQMAICPLGTSINDRNYNGYHLASAYHPRRALLYTITYAFVARASQKLLSPLSR